MLKVTIMYFMIHYLTLIDYRYSKMIIFIKNITYSRSDICYEAASLFSPRLTFATTSSIHPWDYQQISSLLQLSPLPAKSKYIMIVSTLTAVEVWCSYGGSFPKHAIFSYSSPYFGSNFRTIKCLIPYDYP